MWRLGTILASAAIILEAISTQAFAQFSGTFEFRWLADPTNRHRQMQLLSAVSFKDKAGRVWNVPPGTKVDGASIPSALWTFAGSPFVGNYRRASVIHDHYCDLRTERAEDVHRMFRDAMEADGVTNPERYSKYLAVRAYTAFTGACGTPSNELNELSTDVPVEGFDKSDELIATLESFTLEESLGTSVQGRVDEILSVAKIENPVTYATLSEFRRVPTAENYRRLEDAVRIEAPTEEEIEALALLANATVPEGSIALPAQ